MTHAETERWIVENQGLIRKAIAPFVGKGVAYEDLLQEAYLATLLAIKRYDDNRQWALSTWVYTDVLGYVRNMLRKNDRIRTKEILTDSASEMNVSKSYLWRGKAQQPMEDIVAQRDFLNKVIDYVDKEFTDTKKGDFNAIVREEETRAFAAREHIATRSASRRKKKVRDSIKERFPYWKSFLP